MKIDFLMYKVVLALLAMAGVAKTSYAQQEQDMSRGYPNHRVLVAYFSATGTTACVAGKVAQATGGELYAITPAESYTSADLDWNDKQSRSSVEMSDPASRPAIGGEALNADGYDVIFLGYPVWWNLAPRIVNTFVESHDLNGKTVIPFATSGSSGIANSAAALKETYPDIDWKEGKLLNRASAGDIREWVGKLGY